MTYPIRIPDELVDHWRDLYESEGHMPEWVLRYVAIQAANWGSNQELEACCEWLDFHHFSTNTDDLRAARRPHPPSTRRALGALND